MALFVFLFSDFRIVSHSPFAYDGQNRFWNGEPIVAYLLRNNGENWDILIPCNSSELHPAPCMRDVCHVHGFGKIGSEIMNPSLLIS